MADGLLDRRQMRPEALCPKVHFRSALALGLGMDEKPTLVPPEPQISSNARIHHHSPIRPGSDQAIRRLAPRLGSL